MSQSTASELFDLDVREILESAQAREGHSHGHGHRHPTSHTCVIYSCPVNSCG
jgi:hypothetical protein